MPRWADLFASRQLLGFGILVEALHGLHKEILKDAGIKVGQAIIHLLALVVDKFVNYNSYLSSWKQDQSGVRSVFDRHDFAFKATWAEMAPCVAGMGLGWAIENVCEAYEDVATLPHSERAMPVTVSLGSATNLPAIADKSISAVVVDPPYADNVQYSELADFFYVWLCLLGVANRGVMAGIHPVELIAMIRQHTPVGGRRVSDKEIADAVNNIKFSLLLH